MNAYLYTILSMEQLLLRIREIEAIRKEERTLEDVNLLAYLSKQVKIKSLALPLV